MSDLPLGKIIDAGQQRDAIHIAVAPVVAGERLVPGAHIGFIGNDTELVGVRSVKLIGIVDPFLTAIVEREQRFWMFLYPQTITSLRHDWTHPAFEALPVVSAPVKSPSEQWLRECAEDVGRSYQALMRAAADYLENEEYLVGGGEMEGVRTPDDFWKHYAIVTGQPVKAEAGNFFSCSC